MKALLWTDDLLDRMRGLGDPLADAAIAETYDLGQQDQVRKALLGLERNDDPLPTGLPHQMQHYFEEAVLPEWADPALLDRGRTLLGRYESSLVSTLLCYSLVACYSCGDGAQALGMSQRLTSGVYRRLMETSQFLVDVLDKDGLGAGGKGLRSAQKIRLLHATMRYHLSRRKDWDPAWGVPVNQEDLAGTLMSFSVVIPRGLERLGIDLPKADRDAFFHIWRVIGHVLGVDAQLNATSFDDGSALWDTILRRQQSTSEAGIALTKGIVDFIREILPGPALAGVGPTLIRHLTGDKTADLVAVPPADSSQLAIGIGSAVNFGYGQTINTVPLAAQAADELGTVMFKTGLRLTNKGRRYNWEVPTGLTQAH